MTDDRMTDAVFEDALRDLIVAATDDGITPVGGWIVRDVPGHDQDYTVEITRVKKGADD